MVRNPLDMLISYHAQKLYTFEEDEPDFEVAWRLSDLRARGAQLSDGCRAPQYLDYKSMGRLGQQLERSKRYVPERQLRAIVFDDFKTDAAGVYRDALRFLGVRPDNRLDFGIINSRKQHARWALARLLMRPPAPLRRVKAALKRAFPGQAKRLGGVLDRLNQRPAARPQLAEWLRREMAAEFRDDIDLLGVLLNGDFSHWYRGNE